MEMPTPGDAHKKLAQLVGQWTGTETLHPSPWDPKGGSATGRIQNRAELGGFVVVQDYEQERNGTINFRGHGVFGWDAKDQCYTLHWFDTMGMPPNTFRGSFEGNVLSLIDKNANGVNRAIFYFTKSDAYTFKMEVSQDGKQWFAMMDGSYEKVK